jgi:hypothetical protein
VTDTHASTTQGQAAIVAALAAHTAESDGHAPWLAAADLARRTGTTGAHDPQFEADVQALFDAGTIRLMSGGDAGGGRFYKAMLVPPGATGRRDEREEEES